MKKLTVLFMLIIISLFLQSCAKSPLEDTPHENENKDFSPTVVKSDDTDYRRLFDHSLKHEIIVEISQTEWDNMLQDMKQYNAQFGNLRSDTYFKAKMIYKDPEGTIIADEIGFRTKGNTSRVLPQNDDGSFNLSHYKIKFNETFDYPEESKNFKYLNGRQLFDMDEINLKYNRNYDPTYISELFSYQLFNEVGVKAPKATLVDFSIKVGYETIHFGVYTLIESVDKEFLKKRYEKDETDGNLYKSLYQSYGPAYLTPIIDPKAIGIKDVSQNYRPAYDLKTNKKSANYEDLEDFIYYLNLYQGEAFIDFIESNFEVDQFLKLLAIGALIGNPDDYRGLGNNYYFYYNNINKKFEMIPFDYDHGLGQGWMGEPGFRDSPYTIGADIYQWPHALEYHPRPLADKILSIPKYQIKYEEYLNQFLNRNNQIFTYSLFSSTYNNFKSLYGHDAKTSFQGLGFGERNAKWYFSEKTKDVTRQLSYYKTHPNERGVSYD